MEQFVSQFGGISTSPQSQQFISQFGGVTEPPEQMETPATPSPFGSNRGVAPPNSKSPEDFNKSMISGAEQAPMFLGDTVNALTQGITRTAGAAYTGLGGELSPEQAENLTNPTLPFEGSREIYKDAGMPLYDPKTSLGVFGQLLGNAGGMGAIGEAVPLVDAATAKAGDMVMSIPEGIGLRTRGALAKDSESRDMQAESLSNDTFAAYKAVDDAGARLTDKSANGLNNAVRKSYADIKIDPVASPKTVSALKNIYQRITQGKVDPITGDITQEPLSVGEIDQYRRQLARASYGEDTAAAAAARKAIDNYLNNLDESDFVGGNSNNAVNLLNAARATAAKEFKFSDLLDIAKKAGGEPNAIKRLMGKYIDSNPEGLSDTELETFKRAAMRSPAEYLERGLGTFGLDFGKVKNVALPTLIGENAAKGAGALLPHGAPLIGAGTIARQTGKWAARGALEDAMNAIAKRDTSVKPPAPVEPTPPTTPMLALPAPKTVNYVNPAKRLLGGTSAAIPAAMSGAALAAQQALEKGNIGQQNQDELKKLQFPSQPQQKPQSSLPDISKFAKAESNNNPNAKPKPTAANPHPTASGPYQFTNRTWNDVVAKYGKENGVTFSDKNNPQAQATMAAAYAKANIPILQKALGRMPDRGELYAAHVLGPTGASRLLTAPNGDEAIMHAYRSAFDANRSLFFDGKRPRTVAELKQLLAKKVA